MKAIRDGAAVRVARKENLYADLEYGDEGIVLATTDNLARVRFVAGHDADGVVYQLVWLPVDWLKVIEPIDWRAILKDYMRVVIECEGVSFIDGSPCRKQDPEYVKHLTDILREIDAETKSGAHCSSCGERIDSTPEWTRE